MLCSTNPNTASTAEAFISLHSWNILLLIEPLPLMCNMTCSISPCPHRLGDTKAQTTYVQAGYTLALMQDHKQKRKQDADLTDQD